MPLPTRKAALVASGSSAYTLRWVDQETGSLLNSDFSVLGPANPSDLAVSPKGDIWASTMASSATLTWGDLSAGSRSTLSMSGYTPAVASKEGGSLLKFSPDGNWLAVPLINGVDVYKVPEMSLYATIPFSGLTALGVAWRPDSAAIAVVTNHSANTGNLKILTWPGLVTIPFSPGHQNGQHVDCAWSPNGNMLALVHAQNSVTAEISIYNMTVSPATLIITRDETTGGGMVSGPSVVFFSPDNAYMYVVNRFTFAVTAYSTANWSIVAAPGSINVGSTLGMARLSADGQHMVLTTSAGALKVINLTTGVAAVDKSVAVVAPYTADYGNLAREVSNLAGLPVRDVNGNPVSGAKVSLLPHTSNGYVRASIGDTTTDVNGRYRLGCLFGSQKLVLIRPPNPTEQPIAISRVTPK